MGHLPKTPQRSAVAGTGGGGRVVASRPNQTYMSRLQFSVLPSSRKCPQNTRSTSTHTHTMHALTRHVRVWLVYTHKYIRHTCRRFRAYIIGQLPSFRAFLLLDAHFQVHAGAPFSAGWPPVDDEHTHTHTHYLALAHLRACPQPPQPRVQRGCSQQVRRAHANNTGCSST